MLDLQKSVHSAHCQSNHRLMKADRKIGCDKTLPACNNCIRTNRVCAGFGVKLIWPEKYDGRRKSVIRGVDHQKSHNFCQTLAVDFLNTTTEDVEVSHLYNLTNWAQNSHPLRLSTRTLPTYSLPGFTSDEASLLSYCECTLVELMSRVLQRSQTRPDLHGSLPLSMMPRMVFEMSSYPWLLLTPPRPLRA